jgi:hypothetical protein
VAAPAPRATPLADAPTPAPSAGPLDINRLAERWDEIVATVRRGGRALVAQLLEDATPVAVTASGVVTLDVDGSLGAQGLSEAESSVLAAIQAAFPGVTKLSLRTADAAPRKRYDAESVKAERTATLRRDPLLDAAITALDLELLE